MGAIVQRRAAAAAAAIAPVVRAGPVAAPDGVPRAAAGGTVSAEQGGIRDQGDGACAVPAAKVPAWRTSQVELRQMALG